MNTVLQRLGPREFAVLGLIADGKCNKEIAGELGIARSTAKGYVATILAKLSVPNRTGAAGVWFSQKATKPEPVGPVRKAE